MKKGEREMGKCERKREINYAKKRQIKCKLGGNKAKKDALGVVLWIQIRKD
jgi:hypothetical protein